MNRVFKILIFLVVATNFLALLSGKLEAAIYKWKDERGKIHFTDDPNRVPEKYRQNKLEFRPLPKVVSKKEISESQKEEDENAGPPPEEVKETQTEKKPIELTEAEKTALESVVAFFEEDMPRYDSIFNRKLGEGNARKRKWRILRSAVIETIPQKETLLEQISKSELPLLKEIASFLEQVIEKDKKLTHALPQISDNMRRQINHLTSRLKNQASSEEEFIKQIEEAQKTPDDLEKK